MVCPTANVCCRETVKISCFDTVCKSGMVAICAAASGDKDQTLLWTAVTFNNKVEVQQRARKASNRLGCRQETKGMILLCSSWLPGQAQEVKNNTILNDCEWSVFVNKVRTVQQSHRHQMMIIISSRNTPVINSKSLQLETNGRICPI